mmetsp:Transcript_38897/g.82810  ORF Transcript_38897/g.82810 Transcript_38897/m.82810 type:complete len:336 (+) Transcript_38897:172-1179(+)
MEGGFASWDSRASNGANNLYSYGTPEIDRLGGAEAQFAPFAKPAPMRKRLNSVAIAEIILLPWGLFTGVLYLMSFFVHYYHQEAMTFLVICGVLIIAGICVKALQLRIRDIQQERSEPSWFLFVAICCAIAWIAAMILGGINYSSNMRPYYDYNAMSVARNIDPGDIPGAHYLDVSRISFREGAKVREDLSLGFKDGSTYCVAPITMGDTAKYASYDFWAVGVDCCVPDRAGPQFWCGGNIGDPETHGGLRWLSDAEIPKYRLAIEQTQAEYHLKASSPILFSWTKDPVAEVDERWFAGRQYFVTSVVVYGILQILCVGAATYVYAMSLNGGKPP